jgi:hypothetical protein
VLKNLQATGNDGLKINVIAKDDWGKHYRSLRKKNTKTNKKTAKNKVTLSVHQKTQKF